MLVVRHTRMMRVPLRPEPNTPNLEEFMLVSEKLPCGSKPRNAAVHTLIEEAEQQVGLCFNSHVLSALSVLHLAAR